jgi:hypothetical protein
MESHAPIMTRRRRQQDVNGKIDDSIQNQSEDPEAVDTELQISNDTQSTLDQNSVGRKYRPVQKWSQESIDLFYEGIKLHGKNYHAVQRYMSQKLKSVQHTKNYEQIRNHYYYDLKFVQAHLGVRLKDIGDQQIPRDVKELFLLINSSVWLRVAKRVRIKNMAKFRELIMTGSTSLKFAGKPTRTLRTPQCPALKRYFENEESRRFALTLVSPITIELLPRRYADRAHVLSVKHCPNIRVRLSANDSLVAVFERLQSLWNDDAKTEIKVKLYPSPTMKLNDAHLSAACTPPPIISLNEYVRRYHGGLEESSQINDVVQETASSKKDVEVTLSANILQNGITEENCTSFNAGHLALLCDGQTTIRLLYEIDVIDEKAAIKPTSTTWRCLVTLLRRGFGEELTKVTSSIQSNSEIAPKTQPVAMPIAASKQGLGENRQPSVKERNVNRKIIATSTIINNEQHQNEYNDPDYSAFEEQLRTMNNRKGVKKMRQNSGNSKVVLTTPTSFAHLADAEENNIQIQQNHPVTNTCVLIDDMSCSSTDPLQLKLTTNATPSKRRMDTLSIGQFGTDSRGLNSAIGNHLLSSPTLGPTSFAQHTLHTPPRPNR